MTQSKKMARIAYDALNEKKGEDIKIIDIAEVSTLGDYFVIANGNSSSQVTALVDNVEEEMHQAVSNFPMRALLSSSERRARIGKLDTA